MSLRKGALALGILAGICLISVLAVQGQQNVDPRRTDPGDLGRVDREHDVGYQAPRRPPGPIDPQPGTASMPATFQLVGFTSTVMSGGRGVLNMALACQADFAGSRVCTVDEILRTVVVPDSPGSGYAWVQIDTSSVDGSVANCRGWSSSGGAVHGLAMSTGPCALCYGGFRELSCNQDLSAACCAPVALEVP